MQLPSIIPKNHTLIISDGESLLSFNVSDSLPDIELHFPNQKLIAAYYQYIWINFLISKTFENFFVTNILDTKFKEKIIPNENIKISLNWHQDDPEILQPLNFKIESANSKIKSVGKIKVALVR